MPVHQLPPTKRIGGPSLDDGRWWADTKGSSLYDNFIAEAPAVSHILTTLINEYLLNRSKLSIAGHLGDQLADDGGYYTDYAGPRFHHIAGQQQSVKVAKKQAVTVLLDAIQTGKKMGPKAEDGSFMHRVGNLTPIATNETN